VGTTTESCGKPVACDGVSGPGLMASFMGPAYIRSRRCCQAQAQDQAVCGGKGSKIP
jgi:hypothetical protein